MKGLINKAKRLFFSGAGENIFSHKANGEPCCVCKEPMKTKQGITMTGSGDKMHSKCWGEFIESKIDALHK